MVLTNGDIRPSSESTMDSDHSHSRTWVPLRSCYHSRYLYQDLLGLGLGHKELWKRSGSGRYLSILFLHVSHVLILCFCLMVAFHTVLSHIGSGVGAYRA